MDVEKSKKIRLFPVYLVFFVENFGFSLVFTLFGPLLLDPSYHLLESVSSVSDKNFFIAMLFASFPLAQLFASPFIGDIADHYGRKKAFIITLIGSAIGFVLSAFAILIHNYAILLFSRLITGLSASNMGVCLASIADLSTTEKQRGRNYGFIVMSAGLAWISSMLVGGYLSDKTIYPYFNPAVPFLLSAIVSMVALWIVMRYYSETRGIKNREVKFVLIQGLKNIFFASKTPEIRFLYLIYLLWIIGWGAALQWFSPMSIEQYSASQEDVAWGLVAFAIFWILGSSSFNYLILRYLHSTKAACVALIAVIVSFAFGPSLTNYNYFVLVIAFSALFGGVITSNLLNIVSLHAPYHMQGKVMGLTQSVISLSWVVSPVVNGLIARVNITDVYYVAAVFAALVLLALFVQSKLEQKREGKNY